MENFTLLELYNKIYKYLEKNLYYGYRIITPTVRYGKEFKVLNYSCSIMSFHFVDDKLQYAAMFDRSGEINSIEDVDRALKNCDYYFCDRNFSLYLKCGLI